LTTDLVSKVLRRLGPSSTVRCAGDPAAGPGARATLLAGDSAGYVNGFGVRLMIGVWPEMEVWMP
jgi:hypothetical protein